jgi:hypothetical protein
VGVTPFSVGPTSIETFSGVVAAHAVDLVFKGSGFQVGLAAASLTKSELTDVVRRAVVDSFRACAAHRDARRERAGGGS